jgi:hypothetical protein
MSLGSAAGQSAPGSNTYICHHPTVVAELKIPKFNVYFVVSPIWDMCYSDITSLTVLCVATKWLALLLCIQEAACSNVSPDSTVWDW